MLSSLSSTIMTVLAIESLSPGGKPRGELVFCPNSGLTSMRYGNLKGAAAVARKISLSPRELGDLCLGHLAEDAEQLARFMETTGYSPAGLRSAVGSDQLDRGLIDYFAQDESL